MKRRSFLAAATALAASNPESSDDWQGVQRVVAVGDIHGDKDALVAVLQMAGLVDKREEWVGGATHLVQVGDIPARGKQTREAFDFLIRLEKDAAGKGGKVHALIGNHDAGVIYGDLRSTLPEEYAAFAGPDAGSKLEDAWTKHLAVERQAGRAPSQPNELERMKEAWLESHPPGFVEHREAFSPSGPYGQWIRRNNSVIRINDTLFLHGGISPKYAKRTRTSLNATIRAELADPEQRVPGVASDTQGPLWHRGFAEAEPAQIENHLRTVLSFHRVQRIVIGHTVTRSAIMPRFLGRVVNIDIGLSRFYGRPPACLILEGGSQYVLHRGEKIPLAGPGNVRLLDYLKAVKAADEQPSPVDHVIQELSRG